MQPALAEGSGERVEITPSEVFVQVERIDREMEPLRRRFGVLGQPVAEPVQMELKPRHSWQLTYEIMLKINRFRVRHGLPAITVHSLEPVMNLDSGLVYEQTQRILGEVRILQARLGIPGDEAPVATARGMAPIDVVNRLRLVSAGWDLLNGEEPSPRVLFAEAMRIFQDVGFLLGSLGLEDRTYPPEKREGAGAVEVRDVLRELLGEVQRLQRTASIPVVDFDALIAKGGGDASGLLTLTGIVLAELQQLKAHRGLNHALTPPAGSFGEKGLADVVELLHWSARRLRTIREL